MRPRGPRWLYWRFWVQLATTIFVNNGLIQATKSVCWPGLNCWACPTASFACPLGALQNSFGAWRWKVAASGLLAAIALLPWYVIGGLLLIGGLAGRMVCGWLCPFGWFQELLAKLSRVKFCLPRWTGYFRYLILLALVIVIPYWTGQPWFCKLCPQGFLEAGIPQPLLHPELRSGIGWLWYTKLAIFVGIVLAAVVIRRPFCTLFCPLGAIYALMHRYSLWQARFLPDKCTNCMWCVRNCPQGIDPRVDLNSHLCIGCLECQKCPFDAIISGPVWRVERLASESYKRLADEAESNGQPSNN